MAEVLIEDLDSVLLQKLEALAKVHGRSLQAELGWSPGFFERTAGKLEGEPLTRGEQGEYEQRLWELL